MRKYCKKMVLISTMILLSSVSIYCKWTAVDSVRIIHHIDSAGTVYTVAFYFDAIDCYDENNCIVVGKFNYQNAWTRVTSDGGITWSNTLRDTSKIYEINGTDTVTLNPSTFFRVEYPGENLCIITVDTACYWISRDKCKTWKKYRTPDLNRVSGLSFINDKVGLLYASKMIIYYTLDGCYTWNEMKIELPDSLKPDSFGFIKLLDRETIYLLGYKTIPIKKEYLIKSFDFGKSWVVMPYINERMNRFEVLNKDIIIGVGGPTSKTNSSKSRDVIQKTTDGGQTWRTILDTVPEFAYGLNRIQFIDSLHGVVMGQGYKMYRTSDAGETWVRDKSNYELRQNPRISPFRDFKMFSPTKLIAIAGEPSLTLINDEETDVENRQNIESINQVISPNPASDFIEVSVAENGGSHGEIGVYDIFGQNVVSTPVPINRVTLAIGEKIRIDVSDLVPGMYFVRMGAEVRKFVKM